MPKKAKPTTRFQPHRRTEPHTPTNGQRAERAYRALDYWRKGDEADEADFSDLLADLMHYADEQGLDFDRESQRARSHYYTERGC